MLIYSHMMQTINISLPKSLANQVEDTVQKEGYSSKSEFFRTLLRFYLQFTSTTETQKVPTNKLQIFKKKPLNQIKQKLTTTGKYNQSFINSVVLGLSKSSIYQNEN